MKRIIKWIKENKLISTIITGVIIELISTGLISITNKIDFIKSTKMLWNAIYNFFKTILNFGIPVWFILMTVFVLYIILKKIVKIKENKKVDNSWYESYTTDSYKGVLYNWYYYKNDEGKIDIEKFGPICKYCKGNLTTIEARNGYDNLYCPNCDKVLKTPLEEEFEQAEVFVRNNLKKKLEHIMEKRNEQ